nr:hypothetical protein [Actinomycetota bacterium]
MDVRLATEEARRLPTDSTLARGAIAAVRIVFGLLWLTQSSWKIPPFDLLRSFTEYAVSNPVFAPFSFVVEKVVLPNFTIFGWLTTITEVSIGAFLILGLTTRLWA